MISPSVATYAEAAVVRRYPGYGFATLTGLYTIYPGASQIIAARLIEFNIGVATFIAPASVFIYPFIAQAIGMINEVYGRSMTRVAIAIALLYVFDRLKHAYSNRIVLRSAFSDVAGLTLDSVIFVSIAFFTADISLLPRIAGRIVSKDIIGVLDTPGPPCTSVAWGRRGRGRSPGISIT